MTENTIEVRIAFDPESKARFLEDIDRISIRLQTLAREQERLLDNATKVREIESDV